MATQYLNRKEAAAYVRSKGLPCSLSAMAKAATLGGGCPYRTFGRRVVYTAADLDNWIEERLSAPKINTAG